MTDDKGYDWDNRWGVGFELSQKAGYYNYFNICFCIEISFILSDNSFSFFNMFLFHNTNHYHSYFDISVISQKFFYLCSPFCKIIKWYYFWFSINYIFSAKFSRADFSCFIPLSYSFIARSRAFLR